MARNRRKRTESLNSSAGREPGPDDKLSEGVAAGIGLHLQRTLGLEVRSDDFAERQGELRRAAEARELIGVLLDHHIRSDRLRVTVWPELTVEGVVIQMGTNFCSIATGPSGVRHDLPVDRVVSIEPLGSVGEPRPRPSSEELVSFRTRLRHLQALETRVVVHPDVGLPREGMIGVVAPDHIRVDGVTIGLRHIVAVVTPERSPRWRMGR